MANYDQPIIIKKIKKAKHVHHGGAWKIAYADFVTAMMAFFLLLWLISMTSPEQKEGLADYFAPSAASVSSSGSGGVLGGTAMDNSGSLMSGSAADVITDSPASPHNAEREAIENNLGGAARQQGSEAQPSSDSEYDLKSMNDQAFHSAAASIRQAWQALPELTPFMDNLLVERTDEGLDIQIVDQQGRPMFPEGSKYPLEATRAAIAAIGPILQQLNAQVNISGHTAAGGRYDNPRYGPWELSADRANSVRSTLGEFGLSDDRIKSVIGRATDEPFFPNDPYMAANERVRITVLHSAPPVPLGLQP
ncbi:flagellar motor protein MotB [Devosia sp. YIM 151766]|uniref:flagellar motor protein MotB n=1 Tax=Devosia sp. YIM 151766 TaxID=3017325 RepID=UPI00255C883B|nr:flagellar motor protein MotB [Devosia sp. YIM 151766]WIY51818.1 flagellar motor protein MotB [Devosia sp. YIM 151766]